MQVNEWHLATTILYSQHISTYVRTLPTHSKYHLANPIFIGAEVKGLAIEAKIYSSYVEPTPFPIRTLLPLSHPKRFEDIGGWGKA